FQVSIAPGCSGLEGMGLMLVFGVVWLWFFREDYRFPRALLMIPVGLVLIFFLNSLRIAALIMIGHLGAQNVATGGFHSQAGWIAFDGLALGLVSLGHRVRWISAKSAKPVRTEAENPVAPYLIPFWAFLVAGMLSSATAGSFEWMYPLRVGAAGAAILFYRRRYAIDWSFGWAAPVIGTLVFAIWIA